MKKLFCRAHGVRASLPTRTTSYDLGTKPIWTVRGTFGPRSLSDRALDLIDLAGAIYRIESDIVQRKTDPVVIWEVSAPVRDLEFWTNVGGELLAATLGFMNRALWMFRFVSRSKAPALSGYVADNREVDQITLFSGGMDSLCGAGLDAESNGRIQLVSYYHKQSGLQVDLARELGYQPPTQWRLAGRRGKGGMNLVRSFMFLSLAVAVAETYHARRIVQYENGILGTAIPPSGNFIPTRHVHPETHRRAIRLFDAVFDASFAIENPFLNLTKRQVGQALSRSIGRTNAERLLRRTETCWYLNQARVRGQQKENGQPCGVCTPCIVRRTARPSEAAAGAWSGWPGYAFDLKKKKYRHDSVIGMTFRAYLEVVDITLEAPDDASLINELAPEARALLDERNGPTERMVAELLRRFAREFCDTYEVRSGRTASGRTRGK